MKILTILGARPQFIKASSISRAIRQYNTATNNKFEEVIVHTGQHFDKNMSEIFFTELEIPKPDYNLGISNLPHGAMTGRMLESIESVLLEQQPDIVLVYGDTNSTLAGSLAASKINIPVSHVESGLRSFNMSMPEEINRVLTDRVSTYLFCPTITAVKNLKNEGIEQGVYDVGDVMFDVTLFNSDLAKNKISLQRWGLCEDEYILCTIHRAENTDSIGHLSSILEALREIAEETAVILPLHPRTEQIIRDQGKDGLLEGITVLEPLSYLEMLRLEMSAQMIITDSGGVQKEAFFNNVPCITVRNETEWVETLELGWNQLAGANKEKIIDSYSRAIGQAGQKDCKPYGNGNSAQQIINILQESL